jgi:hypothetical protein
VAWNNTSGNTTINNTTFTTDFTNVLTAKQALLDKMHGVALVTGVVIDPISDVIIAADYTGAIKSGELPRQVGITASLGLNSVTTFGTWSMTATTGVTATIGSATGILNITAVSIDEVWIPISFVYSGTTRTGTVHVIVQDDAPPISGGGSSGATGGTTASTTVMGSTTGTSYDTVNAVSTILTATAGSNGQVACTAPLYFKRNPGTSAGQTGAYGKWQWSAHGANTWADVAAEVVDSVDSQTQVVSGDPTVNLRGSLTVNQTQTGLTNGTQYDFRFIWRRNDVSGVANNVYLASGTLTAAGS